MSDDSYVRLARIEAAHEETRYWSERREREWQVERDAVTSAIDDRAFEIYLALIGNGKIATNYDEDTEVGASYARRAFTLAEAFMAVRAERAAQAAKEE